MNPGDRVNIPCSLANMGGSIQFAKDDQPIILDSGCAHCQLDISNDGQASLTINRVTPRDQGHWQCWRLDAAGKVKQKIPIIQLVVTNSPELPILIVNDKELLGGNSLDATITVKENEFVTFKCLIRGASKPVDYVHWMLDSSQNVTHLSQLTMEFSSQEQNYLTESQLKLNATKSMNLKSISCLSNHQLWLTPMTVTAFLNVLYEPSFTISREPGFGIPVNEGMSVILKCEIDSNPTSSPVWIKDADNNKTQEAREPATAGGGGSSSTGEPIILNTLDDGSVQFAPAQTTDSGWYRCKTENKYGNFSSFGYYLNVRPSNASPQSAAAPPTSSSSSSLFPGRPSSLPGRVLAPNQPMARVAPNTIGNNQQAPYRPQQAFNPQQATFNHNQLMTPNDQPMLQEPQQRCKSSASDGAPIVEQPVKVVQAILGRQLVLSLRFCCNPSPTRVFWIHRHLAMIPGRMFGPYITRDVYPTFQSSSCYESTFEIEAVKPEDIGTVFAFVSNEKGLAGGELRIQLAKSVGSLAAYDHQQQHNSIGKSHQSRACLPSNQP